MCSILFSDHKFYGCGATILSCDPVIIVSAAHCFWGLSDFTISRLKIACGDHIVDSAYDDESEGPLDSNEVRLTINNIIFHPDYDSASFMADIAVIQVSDPSRLKCMVDIVWPVCFPNRGQNYAGNSDTLVTGWGWTEVSNLSPTLLKANVELVNNSVCEDAMGADRISDGMVCAGGENKDTCLGDSGGPLVSRSSPGEGYSLVGITSWGKGCAVPGTYGVYTRVAYFMDWVARHFGFIEVG